MKRTLSTFLCLTVLSILNADVLEDMTAFIEEAKASGSINASDDSWRTRLPKFPQVTFGEKEQVEWILNTSEGTLVASLDHTHAPNHVRNIVYLTLLGYYDGLVFHRIIPGFMAQGGCPVGNGRGGPGYGVDLEVSPEAKHDKAGILSMARSQNPNSAGSQFFITFKATPFLDGGYTVFGEVTEGMDVLKTLENAGNPDPRANGVPPRKTIRIESATVRTATADAAP
jgi:cyclophilin family peptidyl-prolyl cis-trans isomerase